MFLSALLVVQQFLHYPHNVQCRVGKERGYGIRKNYSTKHARHVFYCSFSDTYDWSSIYSRLPANTCIGIEKRFSAETDNNQAK